MIYLKFYNIVMMSFIADELKNNIVESPAYGMKLLPNYTLLFDELNIIEENLLNINVLDSLSIVNDNEK